ncbi:MAG: hypothetical protein AUI08_01045 [Gemmatimonadetes bacterium 13_2_20CM_2_65_7]|nr:MAG: hypothetical protein AUI08_01045 [Gemmatimonadetes bacterium 13_2_20CM_2_65_7]
MLAFMTDRERLDLLRSDLLSRRGRVAPTSSCLDDETIAALADGKLGDPEAKAGAMRHLTECEVCRRALASVAGALADEAVRREISASERRTRVRRLLWIIGPLTAAAAVLVFIWPRRTDDRGLPVLRDSAIVGGQAPVLIAPRDRVDRVDRFVWSSVSKASRYRIRLYTDDGALLWNSETADTVVPAPRSPALASGTPYFWMVEAQTEWQRWTASNLVEFRVVGERR